MELDLFVIRKDDADMNDQINNNEEINISNEPIFTLENFHYSSLIYILI